MKHTLKGEAVSRSVWLDGAKLDPRPSQKVHNHSPDGFNWGHEGSGPAQLALAIILAITGTFTGYQEFKRKVIAKLPTNKPFRIEFDYPDADPGYPLNDGRVT
jgi:hypothetical protein